VKEKQNKAKTQKQSKVSALSEHISIVSMLKGLLVSYIIVIFLFAFFAIILANTDFPEKYLPTAVLITTIISVITAGSTVTKRLKNKGWLNGGIVGLIYMLILYILSSIVYEDFSVNRYTITMIIIGMLSGAIGGILGINLRKPPRAKARA